MSRPPWGKVAPTGDGRGELAFINRLPTTPTTTTQTKPHQTRKAIQHRKRAPPLRHPNGCHLSPKGEAYLYVPLSAAGYPSDCEAGARKKPSPFGGRGTAPAVEGGNSLAT